MHDNSSKLGVWEVVALASVLSLAPLLLTLATDLAQSMGTGTVLHSIYIAIVFGILFSAVVLLLSRFKGMNILDISKICGGKFLIYFSGIIYIIYLFSVSSVAISEFSKELKNVVFINSPEEYLCLMIIAGSTLGAFFGLKAIFRTNGILFPLIVGVLLLIYFSIRNKIDITNYTPLFGFDYNTFFFSGISKFGRYAGFMIFLIYTPIMANVRKSSWISIIVSSLIIILMLYMIFGVIPYPSTTENFLPVFELTRLVGFGRFFQRMDSVFTFFWILGSMTYFSVTVFSMAYVFGKIFNLRYLNRIIPLVSISVITVSFLISNFTSALLIRSFIYYNITPIMLVAYPLILLIWATFKTSRRNLNDTKISS